MIAALIAGVHEGLARDVAARGGVILDPRAQVEVTAIYRFAEAPTAAERAVALCRFRGEPPELAPLALLGVRVREAYEQAAGDLMRLPWRWPSDPPVS